MGRLRRGVLCGKTVVSSWFVVFGYLYFRFVSYFDISISDFHSCLCVLVVEKFFVFSFQLYILRKIEHNDGIRAFIKTRFEEMSH